MKDTSAALTLFAATGSTWLADLNSVLVTLLALANLLFIVWRFVSARRTKSRKDDEDWQIPIKTLACICGLSCFTGCAVVRQSLETTEGEKRQVTKASAVVFWQSGQALEKLRVSNGKTHSIGVSGLDQETTGGDSMTNVVAGLQAIRAILGK